jgi:acetylornithine/succinyldiaminopimelate/putrescine aminotransferase
MTFFPRGAVVWCVEWSGVRGVQLEKTNLVPTYNTNGVRMIPELELSHGQGSTLYDTKGQAYLDFASGIAVNSLGYGDQGFAQAVASQMLAVQHTSNVFHTRPPLEVAKRLVSLSAASLTHVFLCNSGTEANEAALKFTKLYHARAEPVQKVFACEAAGAPATLCRTHGGVCDCWTSPLSARSSRTTTVAFQGGFHGRSMGSLSVTHKPKIRAPFAPVMTGDVQFVPFNDADALEAVMGEHVSSVILEPIQGEGGVMPARPGFLQRVRELTKAAGALMIVDEVQTVGRTGQLFAHQTYGVQPDIVTVAKGLGGGMPVGATLVSTAVAAAVPPGSHGTTFGGNPAVAAGVLYVLDRMETPGFWEAAKASGRAMREGLLHLAAKHPTVIHAVRTAPGDGLYAGVQLRVSASAIVARAAAHKLFILSAGHDDVLRIAPPLVVTKDEVSAFIATLDTVLSGQQ